MSISTLTIIGIVSGVAVVVVVFGAVAIEEYARWKRGY